MAEFFLTLIIILAFICTLTVIIGIKSSSKVFPIISVCCAVMIISFAFFASIEMKSAEAEAPSAKAYIPSVSETETETEKSETEAETTEAEEKHKTVYITRTGTKYHYSYNCSDSDFYECTLEEALERGLEPCGRCVK